MNLLDIVKGINRTLTPLANSAPVRGFNQAGLDYAQRNIVNPLEQGVKEARQGKLLKAAGSIGSGGLNAVTPPSVSQAFNINNPFLSLGLEAATLNPKGIAKQGLKSVAKVRSWDLKIGNNLLRGLSEVDVQNWIRYAQSKGLPFNLMKK